MVICVTPVVEKYKRRDVCGDGNTGPPLNFFFWRVLCCLSRFVALLSTSYRMVGFSRRAHFHGARSEQSLHGCANGRADRNASFILSLPSVVTNISFFGRMLTCSASPSGFDQRVRGLVDFKPHGNDGCYQDLVWSLFCIASDTKKL